MQQNMTISRKTLNKLATVLLVAVVLASASFYSLKNSEPVYALNTTYYVDATNGSDANDGLTEATAWQTYAKAFSVRGTLGAGDSMLFKRGETFAASGVFNTSTSGVAGAPITIGAYGVGAKPILNYTITNHGIDLRNDSHITIENLDIRGFDVTGIVASIGSTNINLMNLNISAPNGASAFGILFVNGGVMSSQVLIDGVRVTNATATGISIGSTNNIAIRNSIVTGSNAHGVSIEGSTNVSVENLDASDNGGSGFTAFGSVGDSNITVNDSTLTNNVSNGLSLVGNGQNITVSHTIANNNFDGFNVHGDWHGVVFDHCAADENGTLGSPSGADGDGYTFHDTSSGIIRYSTAHNNVKSAVAHVGGAQAEMYYNIFTHDTNGEVSLVYLGGDGSYTLANSIVHSASHIGNGITINDSVDMVLQNTIVNGFERGVVYSAAGLFEEGYNLVYGASVAAFSGFIPSVHTQESNPLFVDVASRDFRLTADSPAINAGVALAYTADFAGNSVPQNSLVDIGAYEFIATSGSGREGSSSDRQMRVDEKLAETGMNYRATIALAGSLCAAGVLFARRRHIL